MKRLPPKRIGRVIGMGADASGLNPGDPGYDSTSDPNSPDYVLQGQNMGGATINANSVPEGSTGQTSTGSGTLNAITPSGGGTLQIPEITVSGTVPTKTAPAHTTAGPRPSSSALASMTILGLPWWMVLAAVGVSTVFAAMEMRGPRRTGTRRRKRKGLATHRRAAARRRGGRRRNPAKRSKKKGRKTKRRAPPGPPTRRHSSLRVAHRYARLHAHRAYGKLKGHYHKLRYGQTKYGGENAPEYGEARRRRRR